MTPLTQVTQEDQGEVGVAPGGRDGDAVTDRPERESGQPLLQAKPNGKPRSSR